MKLTRSGTAAVAIAAAFFAGSVVTLAVAGDGAKPAAKKKRGPRGPAGAQGAQGAQGAPGAPGAPATALFAAADSDGTLTAQGGVVGTVSHVAASGSYTITFNRNVDACAPVASRTNDDPGEILASVLGGANNTVSVFTQDSGGTLGDSAFSVAVFCN